MDYKIEHLAMNRAMRRNEIDRLRTIKDGDSYEDATGHRQTFHKIRKPVFSDPTWSTLTDRAATFLFAKKRDIQDSNTIDDFMKNTTIGETYEIMLTAETADEKKKNLHFEDVISFSQYISASNTQDTNCAEDYTA